MELWSNVKNDFFDPFYSDHQHSNTPVLQYSSTPILQARETRVTI
jgi:hypothetical protein